MKGYPINGVLSMLIAGHAANTAIAIKRPPEESYDGTTCANDNSNKYDSCLSNKKLEWEDLSWST